MNGEFRWMGMRGWSRGKVSGAREEAQANGREEHHVNDLHPQLEGLQALFTIPPRYPLHISYHVQRKIET